MLPGAQISNKKKPHATTDSIKTTCGLLISISHKNGWQLSSKQRVGSSSLPGRAICLSEYLSRSKHVQPFPKTGLASISASQNAAPYRRVSGRVARKVLTGAEPWMQSIGLTSRSHVDDLHGRPASLSRTLLRFVQAPQSPAVRPSLN